jgi:D-alanyl-D-alanine dipeptidase
MISHVSRHLRLTLALPLFILASCLTAFAAPQAQTSPSAADSLLPGPKPADVPFDWKRIIGIYGKDHSVLLLERDQELFYRDSTGVDKKLIPINSGMFTTDPNDPPVIKINLPAAYSLSNVPFLGISDKTWPRTDPSDNPGHFYHVSPAPPVAELRRKALKLTPPTEPGPFREPDLTEIVKLDAGFHLEIRYARYDNFLSAPVYTQARAFMQRPAAEALLRVLHKLLPLGYGLLIHDAYRPWYVTKIFWDATPPEGKIFVADPQKGSKHNRGCAVDLTLYDLATGQPVEMPGLYDEMSPRSFANFPGGTSLQRWHRDLLRRAMESEGFSVNEDEWWHFDYKDWKQYGILNVPFEKIALGVEPKAVSHKP